MKQSLWRLERFFSGAQTRFTLRQKTLSFLFEDRKDFARVRLRCKHEMDSRKRSTVSHLIIHLIIVEFPIPLFYIYIQHSWPQ